MSQFTLFIRHAFLHLVREKQRTLFVLFCIAAGVAAVVALRTLVLLGVGLSLAATLITAWGAAREKPLNVLRYE
jgi:ABC-type lipoprotein release transport system permease subunit